MKGTFRSLTVKRMNHKEFHYSFVEISMAHSLAGFRS